MVKKKKHFEAKDFKKLVRTPIVTISKVKEYKEQKIIEGRDRTLRREQIKRIKQERELEEGWGDEV